MTKLHKSYPSSASSKLGIGRDSHVNSKFKPKIRIIHIYAPEVIKTDAANFRELVQRLTGKPEDENNKSKTSLTKDSSMDLNTKKAMIMQKDGEEFHGMQNGERVKNNEHKEEQVDDGMWTSKSNEKFNGFFDEFPELDGFMEELSTTMPIVNQD